MGRLLQAATDYGQNLILQSFRRCETRPGRTVTSCCCCCEAHTYTILLLTIVFVCPVTASVIVVTHLPSCSTVYSPAQHSALLLNIILIQDSQVRSCGRTRSRAEALAALVLFIYVVVHVPIKPANIHAAQGPGRSRFTQLEYAGRKAFRAANLVLEVRCARDHVTPSVTKG